MKKATPNEMAAAIDSPKGEALLKDGAKVQKINELCKKKDENHFYHCTIPIGRKALIRQVEDSIVDEEYKTINIECDVIGTIEKIEFTTRSHIPAILLTGCQKRERYYSEEKLIDTLADDSTFQVIPIDSIKDIFYLS